jgi:hypothetical protein
MSRSFKKYPIGLGDFQDTRQLLLDFVIWCDDHDSIYMYREEYHGKEKELIDEFLKERLDVDNKPKT